MAIPNKLTIGGCGKVSLRVLMPLRFDSSRIPRSRVEVGWHAHHVSELRKSADSPVKDEGNP